MSVGAGSVMTVDVPFAPHKLDGGVSSVINQSGSHKSHLPHILTLPDHSGHLPGPLAVSCHFYDHDG